MQAYHSIDGRSRDGGSVMLMTLIISLFVTLTLSAALMKATEAAKSSRYSMDQFAARALAEGITEAAQKRVLELLANDAQPADEMVQLDSETYPYSVAPLGAGFDQTASDGASMGVQPYRITAMATVGDVTSTVKRVVFYRSTPIFQHMIFYDADLEIDPLPDMNITGRVHVNGSVYFAPTNNVTIDTDYFRSAGQIFRHLKDGSLSGGAVNIKVAGENRYESLDVNYDSSYADWLNYSTSRWNGSVQSAAHGVKAAAAPKLGTIKAFDPDTGEKGFYHAEADLVIIDDKAYDRDGNVLSMPFGTIQEKSMYDAREGKFVTVTELDMGLLNGAPEFPANGVLYAYRTDASTAQPNGIRLANGESVQAPLTVISEDPVYIHGDFNTVARKPVAVISDAVNLLSNGWDDSKSPAALPGATDTTYNVAMITGNVPTPDDNSSYSGGFENLPRFHEDWTGVSATISGAFINIFESDIARSPFEYGGDVYLAPTRAWSFDAGLMDPSNLPPATPNATIVDRILWDDEVPSHLGGSVQ